jgi:hypothetical protein
MAGGERQARLGLEVVRLARDWIKEDWNPLVSTMLSGLRGTAGGERDSYHSLGCNGNIV